MLANNIVKLCIYFVAVSVNVRNFVNFVFFFDEDWVGRTFIDG